MQNQRELVQDFEDARAPEYTGRGGVLAFSRLWVDGRAQPPLGAGGVVDHGVAGDILAGTALVEDKQVVSVGRDGLRRRPPPHDHQRPRRQHEQRHRCEAPFGDGGDR